MTEPKVPAAVRDLDRHVARYRREFPNIDPQVERIVAAIFRLNRRMDLAYARQLRTLDITNAEWEVLKELVLAGRPYRLTPGELAKRLGLTPAAMTHRIDRMLDDGLVTRTRDESNRVRVIIELTPKGRDKWLEAMRLASGFEEELLSDLEAADREAMAAMLTRMLVRVEATQPDATGRTDDLDQP
ncbi:MarR family winged helix-turn-helix transcriptional regulator [Phaeacidiphilus oryzae]|jgi:DNA-binding MarR family transcriptional regulator|uniref:MarR family winged helix-turn-helix transcriptional regulator n=1 Tax=Phaeacidiphilus oryzae TaxID=348818 RepID=UPI00068B7FEF|nr:MarR family transcriptional regulator [Phaeacidiphilus oryzae]